MMVQDGSFGYLSTGSRFDEVSAHHARSAAKVGGEHRLGFDVHPV